MRRRRSCGCWQPKGSRTTLNGLRSCSSGCWLYLRSPPPMSLLASNWLPTTSYRVVDPIENLRLQVTLRKRGTQGVRKLKKAEKSPSARRRPRTARRTRTTRRPRTTTRRRSAPRRRRRRRSSRRRRSVAGEGVRAERDARAAADGGRRQPRERRARAAARAGGRGLPAHPLPRAAGAARRRGGGGGRGPPRGVGAAHADLVGVCRRRHVVDRAVHDERAREGDAARALRPLGADGGAAPRRPRRARRDLDVRLRRAAFRRRRRHARALALVVHAALALRGGGGDGSRACSCCCARCGSPHRPPRYAAGAPAR